MKALVSLILAVALVGGIYVATTSGCGARGAVAKDKVVDQIDKLLGKLNVQKKEIEIQFADLRKQTNEVQISKIRAQVKLEQLTDEKTSLTSQMATLDSNLKSLAPMLKAAQETGTFEKGDKKYSVDQLKTIADATIKKRKSIKAKLDGKLATLIAAYSKNLDFLTKQASAADTQLEKLEERIAEIEAKKEAIDAVKEASLLAGPDQSITDKFEKLNSDVDALLGEVEVTMRIEEAKLDEQIAGLETEELSIEELLKDDTDVSGTLSEIESILNDNNK